MTNASFKNSLFIILASILLASCASNPADDQFTDAELAPEVEQAVAVAPTEELKTIDAKLSSVEAQIVAAQARLTKYQAQNSVNPVNQSLITGAEAEISHYQSLKSDLISKKAELSSQSIVK